MVVGRLRWMDKLYACMMWYVDPLQVADVNTLRLPYTTLSTLLHVYKKHSNVLRLHFQLPITIMVQGYVISNVTGGLVDICLF